MIKIEYNILIFLVQKNQFYPGFTGFFSGFKNCKNYNIKIEFFF